MKKGWVLIDPLHPCIESNVQHGQKAVPLTVKPHSKEGGAQNFIRKHDKQRYQRKDASTQKSVMNPGQPSAEALGESEGKRFWPIEL